MADQQEQELQELDTQIHQRVAVAEQRLPLSITAEELAAFRARSLRKHTIGSPFWLCGCVTSISCIIVLALVAITGVQASEDYISRLARKVKQQLDHSDQLWGSGISLSSAESDEFDRVMALTDDLTPAQQELLAAKLASAYTPSPPPPGFTSRPSPSLEANELSAMAEEVAMIARERERADSRIDAHMQAELKEMEQQLRLCQQDPASCDNHNPAAEGSLQETAGYDSSYDGSLAIGSAAAAEDAAAGGDTHDDGSELIADEISYDGEGSYDDRVLERPPVDSELNSIEKRLKAKLAAVEAKERQQNESGDREAEPGEDPVD